MATHSSILAWEITWTEEPGRLQSMGSQSRTRLKQFSTHTYTYDRNRTQKLSNSWGKIGGQERVFRRYEKRV